MPCAATYTAAKPLSGWAESPEYSGMLLRDRVLTSFSTAALALGVLGALGATATAASAEPQRSDDGAVVVRAAGEIMDSIGAGTVVGVDGTTVTVLTAKHVATLGPLSVKFADGVKVAAKIESLVPDRDLALVTAEVDATYASSLHVAHVSAPRTNSAVHVWGSGISGPAYEPAAVLQVGAILPDGAIRNRYTVNCDLCHAGDSGAGVFDTNGNLVGVFVGYFEIGKGKLGVAEQPLDSAALAAAGGAPTPRVASAPAVTPSVAVETASIVAATFGSR